MSTIRPGEPLPDRMPGKEVRRYDAALRALLRDPGYVARLREGAARMEGFTNPYVFLASDLDDPNVTVR